MFFLRHVYFVSNNCGCIRGRSIDGRESNNAMLLGGRCEAGTGRKSLVGMLQTIVVTAFSVEERLIRPSSIWYMCTFAIEIECVLRRCTSLMHAPYVFHLFSSVMTFRVRSMLLTVTPPPLLIFLREKAERWTGRSCRLRRIPGSSGRTPQSPNRRTRHCP